AHGYRAARNARGVFEHVRAVFNGLRCQRLAARARMQRGQRLVPSNLPVRTDGQELQVNPADVFDLVFVAPAFGVQVGGDAIGQARPADVDVDVIEQVPVEIIPAGVRMAPIEADVFVQAEGR